MAQLKVNSNLAGDDIANINLEGVLRSNFSTTHLAEIKGTNGTAASVSKSSTTLSSTSSSSINLSSPNSLRFNGVDRGYSKIHLNGTRIWERYEVEETYQEWVTSGYNQSSSSWVEQPYQPSTYILRTWENAPNGYLHHVRLYNTVYYYIPSGYRQGRCKECLPGYNQMYYVEKYVTTTTWIDTSHYEDRTRMVETFYY